MTSIGVDPVEPGARAIGPSGSPVAAATSVVPSPRVVGAVPATTGGRAVVSRSVVGGPRPAGPPSVGPRPLALVPPWSTSVKSVPPSLQLDRSEPVGARPAREAAPAVQREEAVASVPATAPAAPSATVHAGSSTGSAEGSGLVGSDDQIDQLAKRLYPRIRDRIRIDARLDRERAGRGLDLRR